MRLKNIQALLLLKMIPNIGPVLSKKLIDTCGSAPAIFEENPDNLKLISGIDVSRIQGFYNINPLLKKVDKELDFIEKHKIETIEYTTENYPETLSFCPDAPLILFFKGNINWKNRKIISIVGTRKNTIQGKEFCKKLIKDLSAFNPIIVSGFAYGIDIIAHNAALKNNLETVACWAHSFNDIYPKEHKKYIVPIEKQGGFLSDFLVSEDFEIPNFVRRNRIIAGLSHTTIVIESGIKGGSMITANFASNYNREVFAVPGRPKDPYSKGCNQLIQTEKARLLNQYEDIIYWMQWEMKNNENKPKQKELFISLDEDEKKIVDILINKGQKTLDSLSLECNFTISKTASILMLLEMKNYIRCLPGKKFELIF